MGIKYNKWPIDGSQKSFQGTVSWCAGTLDYLGRAYEQSVLVCGLGLQK